MTNKAATRPVHHVAVGAFVPSGMKESLVQRARDADRTISAEIRVALRRHLRAND
jgi:hypothetical protein